MLCGGHQVTACSNSWTMKDKTLNNTDWQMGLMSMMLCHKSCETKQNHEMENVIENVICLKSSPREWYLPKKFTKGMLFA